MQTSIAIDHKPAQDGRHLVRMLLKLAGTPPENGARTPLNLSIVLDRSGSMAGDRLDAAKQAAAQLVRRLWPEDIVSVVSYDDAVTTVAPPASGEGQADLSARIAAIGAGGSTNLSGGWLRGRELVATNVGAGRHSRVLLLTDGQANVGITDHATLAGLCSKARTDGITTTAIGFGMGYDEQLLRAMADAGGGAMYYIEHADQAVAIFAEELSDLLATTAQNVTVTVRPGDGVELAAVHHGYTRVPDGDALRLEIGDLYAREPRTLLAEFLVAPGTAAADGANAAPFVTLVVRGVVISGSDVSTETVTLPVRFDAAGEPRVDAEIEREALITAAAAVREAALEDRLRGDLAGAAARLSALAERLRASGLDDAQILEEIQDLSMSSQLYASGMVAEEDVKYAAQRAYETRRGRSAKSDLISRNRR
jgi:Ca-activated chloride channel homolog